MRIELISKIKFAAKNQNASPQRRRVKRSAILGRARKGASPGSEVRSAYSGKVAVKKTAKA